MPTVLRIGSFRFFFYSNEGNEPPHIHVQEGNCLAKFWLDPVDLATSVRFDSHHLTKLQKLIKLHFWASCAKSVGKIKNISNLRSNPCSTTPTTRGNGLSGG